MTLDHYIHIQEHFPSNAVSFIRNTHYIRKDVPNIDTSHLVIAQDTSSLTWEIICQYPFRRVLWEFHSENEATYALEYIKDTEILFL